MKKQFFYGILLGFLGLTLFHGAQIYFASAHAAEKDDPYPSLNLFNLVLDKVRKEYVDHDKLTYQDLIHGALKGMLSTLDPHSEFMEPPKYDELKKDTQGEFGGVGVVISTNSGFLAVVAPMEDTPGFKAGILAGDRILKIDGTSTERLSLPDAVKKMRGPAGTVVTLSILRPTSGQVRDYTLTRSLIKIDTVKDQNGKREFPLMENKVGYVRLAQFGEQTSSDLEDALSKLEKQGVESLVLDLRDNPGGLLDQAVLVCEKFLPNGQLVVSTEGRNSEQKHLYYGKGRGKHPAIFTVVLVNGGSASAAEIVAGCLQDCAALGVTKAVILGEQTFGKGSVQSILPLPDNSALRLTTAKYYTPSHKVIHEHGITPDIPVPMSDEEMRDIFLKHIPGGIESLPDADQERVRNARDPQLDRALDMIKGISLYTRNPPAEPKKPAKTDKVAAK